MNTDIDYIRIPLTTEAHETALQFAAEQLTVPRGKKIYLNTLAVYAVHYYLEWAGIETDLSSSDSWHPGLRCLLDTADLVIPNVGKLECCRVLLGETVIYLAPEVTTGRIAYVIVQIDEEYIGEVKLRGFISGAKVEQLPLEQTEELNIEQLLQPLEDLASFLRELKS